MENHHVAPLDGAGSPGTGVPNGRSRIVERSETARGEPGLGFLHVEITGVVARVGGISRRRSRGVCVGVGGGDGGGGFVGGGRQMGEEEVEFDAAFGLFAEVRPGFGRSQVEFGVGVVGDSPGFRAHDRAEERVHEMEDGLMAAKVLGQRGDRLVGTRLPGLGVGLKNPGISAPEAVDGLLDVADEKSIRLGAGSAEALKDAVLGAVDVLDFVDADMVEVGLPLAGEAGGLAGVGIPEQAQGELLEVGEIDDRGGAAGLGEALVEFIHQFQEGDAVVAAPIPILVEGVGVAIDGGRREQLANGIGFRDEFLEGLEPACDLALFPAASISRFDQGGEKAFDVGEDTLGVGWKLKRGEAGEFLEGCGAGPGGLIRGVEASHLAGVIEPTGRPLGDPRSRQGEPMVGKFVPEGGELAVDPTPGIRKGAGEIMDFKDSLVERLDVFPGVPGEKRPDARGLGGRVFEMAPQEIAKDGGALDLVLDRVLDGELGIQFEFMKVFPDESEAKRVEGGDESGVEKGALFGDPGVLGIRLEAGVEGHSEAVSHLRGGGLVEGDDEQAVEGSPPGGIQRAVEDPGDECAGLAGPGSGHDEDVSIGPDGDLLLGGGSCQGRGGSRSGIAVMSSRRGEKQKAQPA